MDGFPPLDYNVLNCKKIELIGFDKGSRFNKRPSEPLLYSSEPKNQELLSMELPMTGVPKQEWGAITEMLLKRSPIMLLINY